MVKLWNAHDDPTSLVALLVRSVNGRILLSAHTKANAFLRLSPHGNLGGDMCDHNDLAGGVTKYARIVQMYKCENN